MFPRSFDSIPEIVSFTAGEFARQRIDAALLPDVDFALEELFTNMVKYSTMTTADVCVELTGIDGGVEVTMTDYDVEPFDVTTAPDVDIRQSLEERQPGGLGLHLIRRLVDSIEYEYSAAVRRSRIKFRKTTAESPASGGAENSGGKNARD